MENLGLILGIAIPVVVLIIVGVILFYFLYWKKHHMNQLIDQIEKEYNYYSSLLNINCQNLITRIELISHRNIVYNDYYVKFSKQKNEILNSSDRIVESKIHELTNMEVSKKYTDFKNVYPEALKELEIYRKKIDALDNELTNLMEPEEALREKGLRVKENNNILHKRFLSNLNSLGLAIPTFEKLFAKTENKFKQFEDKIDSAQYEEAEEILDPIVELNSRLGPIIDELPSVCGIYEEKLPAEVKVLREKYDKTIEDNVPLFHIANESTFKMIQGKNDNIRKLIVNLKSKEAKAELDKLFEKIAEINDAIDKEVSAKEFYENNFTDIYKKANEVLKRTLKFHNDFSKYSEYYVLNSKHQKADDMFTKLYNEVDNKKSVMDGYSTFRKSEYYSKIQTDLIDLRDKTEEIENFISEFESHISELKSSAESAHKLVFDSVNPLKINENTIKKIKIDSQANDDLIHKIDRCFDLLNKIYLSLVNKPIDMDKINAYIIEFKSLNEEINNKKDIYYTSYIKSIELFRKLGEPMMCFEMVAKDVEKAKTLFDVGNYPGSFEILKKSFDNRKELHS